MNPSGAEVQILPMHSRGARPFRTFARTVLPKTRTTATAGRRCPSRRPFSFLGGPNNPVAAPVAIEYFSTGRISKVAAVALIVTVVAAGFVPLASAP